jgi:hypothetical protein
VAYLVCSPLIFSHSFGILPIFLLITLNKATFLFGSYCGKLRLIFRSRYFDGKIVFSPKGEELNGGKLFISLKFGKELSEFL